jgi:hypothetical protein
MGLGGGSGIRTHDTVARIHAFQACAFSHSAIPPAANGNGGTIECAPPSASGSHPPRHLPCRNSGCTLQVRPPGRYGLGEKATGPDVYGCAPTIFGRHCPACCGDLRCQRCNRRAGAQPNGCRDGASDLVGGFAYLARGGTRCGSALYASRRLELGRPQDTAASGMGAVRHHRGGVPGPPPAAGEHLRQLSDAAYRRRAKKSVIVGSCNRL